MTEIIAAFVGFAMGSLFFWLRGRQTREQLASARQANRLAAGTLENIEPDAPLGVVRIRVASAIKTLRNVVG